MTDTQQVSGSTKETKLLLDLQELKPVDGPGALSSNHPARATVLGET